MAEHAVRIKDDSGHNMRVYADGTIPTSTAPEGAVYYVFGIHDVAGVVAANNFLTLMNPVGNTKSIIISEVIISSYAINQSSTPNSMTLSRISSSTGGTDSSASIIKVDTGSVAATGVVRTANPTVVTVGNSFFSTPPPIAGTGGGVGSATAVSSPSDIRFYLKPGEGVVFSTAAGNVNQLWGLTITWAEV